MAITRQPRMQSTSLPTVEPALAYSVEDAAILVDSSRSQLYEDIRDQRLVAIKNGARTLIRHEALVAYLDLLEAEAEQATRWRR